MEAKEKKPYVAPTVTTVTFKVEQGYAASGDVVQNYLWGAAQLWDASDAGNSTSDYSWGNDQNWF